MCPHSDWDRRPTIDVQQLTNSRFRLLRYCGRDLLSGRRPRSRRLSEDQHYTRHEKQNQYDVGELRFVESPIEF
jgi:hypothetical protein